MGWHYFEHVITLFLILIILGVRADPLWFWFLAVQNSSIGLIVRPLLAWSDQTNNQSLHNTTEWPQRLVTFETFDQSERRHDLTQKNHPVGILKKITLYDFFF